MTITGAARDIWRRSPAARIGITAAAMVLVAEGAVLLLSPGDEGIAPVATEADDYFAAEAIARAREYRGGQRTLLVVGLGAQALAVGALAVGRPRVARRALGKLASRPLAGPAVAGIVVVAVAELASLPTALAAHERSVDAGLSTQSLASWLADDARSLAIAAVITAGAASALAALVRRHPRGWWLPAAGGATMLGVALTVLGPVLIAPQFNRFEELPEGSALRAGVIELGERAGVEIGEVYRVDASRRSTMLNAYVDGLGPTKRVVLYDTLIAGTERPALESVVAHELGYVASSDIPRGLAFAALVAPLGMLFSRELASALARRAGAQPGSVASVPALLLAIAVAASILGVPGNQLSRRVEASADAFALRLTDDPQALIAVQRTLARRNLADPEPPGWARTLFGTHPTTMERIGTALAYERQIPPPEASPSAPFPAG